MVFSADWCNGSLSPRCGGSAIGVGPVDDADLGELRSVSWRCRYVLVVSVVAPLFLSVGSVGSEGR